MTERPSSPRLRCAIYTRKSTEEGLEQAFNSLHAQREACEAFIASQRHQGWVLDPTQYDDGGFSGGTIERPALKRLMQDIEVGRIDVIVVYKVDRLTRALSDFAKLVDLFDRKQVSFVSITQQFNTTTSMGRLTLNVLLSFAQFEREVIGERIRDKIAASKRKGMWMGGQPPLGYDVHARKLVVNETEAITVVAIFRRYLELRSVHALRDELHTNGVSSKRRCRPDGSAYGGQPLGRGGLYAMLQNRIYRGEITHKGDTYPGEHHAIIDQELWAQVQAQLAGSRDERASGSSAKEPALLGGILFDTDGERLTPTHAVKNGTRYRYYVSASLVRGRTPTRSAWRIPASDLDGIVIQALCGLSQDPTLLLEAFGGAESHASPARSLITQARALAQQLSSALASQQRVHLVALGCRIVVGSGHVELQISRAKLLQHLLGANASWPEDAAGENLIRRTIAVSLKRAGREMRMVDEGAVCRHTPDPSLVRLLGRAHDLHGKLVSDPSLAVAKLAVGEKLSVAYIYRLLRLRWLSPDIVVAIMCGRQPRSLNATVLMHQKFRFPIGWSEQRRHFGIG